MSKKIVVRFKDKTMLKGRIIDFSPFYNFFKIELLNGDLLTLDMDKIKAIFFVKTFDGDKKYEYNYADELSCFGEKIALKFKDGEKMIGYTQYIDFSPKGFFIIPADLKGNNDYVFAGRSSIESMSFF